jgi:hypothetical protein
MQQGLADCNGVVLRDEMVRTCRYVIKRCEGPTASIKCASTA